MLSIARNLRDYARWLFCAIRYAVPIRRAALRSARGVRLARQNGRGADLHDTRFHLVSLPGVDLQGADLSKASFIQADLSGANLREANLSFARFTNSRLRAAVADGAHLHWASFIKVDFRDASLVRADLTRARFWSHGDLPPGANRCDDGETGTTLAGADLREAVLVAADLTGVDLTGANLTGVRADAFTRWPEGYLPQEHGVVVRPMADALRLHRGDTLLGTLYDCRPALPWFRCRFEPTAAFETVRPLFDTLLRCRDARKWEECIAADRAIQAPGLRLESDDGERIEDFLLYVEGQNARFRY